MGKRQNTTRMVAKMKYDEYDIQTACDIATGDDGMTGKEVIRVLKQFVKIEKQEKENEIRTTR